MELTPFLQILPPELINHIVINTRSLFAINSFRKTCKKYYSDYYCIDTFISKYNIFPLTNREHTHALVHYAQTNNQQLFEKIIETESTSNKKQRQKILTFFSFHQLSTNCTYCSMQAYKAQGYSFINYYQKAISEDNLIGLKILTMNKIPIFIDAPDRGGRTLLIHAVLNNNENITYLLLKNKCKINIQDKSKNTALHYACHNNNKNLVQLLLNNKCLLNIQNVNRNTPLHIATKNNNINIAQLLINNGAQITIKNIYNKTALDYLSEKDKNDLKIKKRKLENTKEISVYKKQRR